MESFKSYIKKDDKNLPGTNRVAPSKREEGTNSLASIYKKDTPGQTPANVKRVVYTNPSGKRPNNQF